MITAIIIISILLLVSIYVNINLLRKNEDITDRVMDQDDIIFSFLNKVEDLYTHVKEIDSRGSFESDDETGVIFEEIKNSIKLLRENIDE